MDRPSVDRPQGDAGRVDPPRSHELPEVINFGDRVILHNRDVVLPHIVVGVGTGNSVDASVIYEREGEEVLGGPGGVDIDNILQVEKEGRWDRERVLNAIKNGIKGTFLEAIQDEVLDLIRTQAENNPNRKIR